MSTHVTRSTNKESRPGDFVKTKDEMLTLRENIGKLNREVKLGGKELKAKRLKSSSVSRTPSARKRRTEATCSQEDRGYGYCNAHGGVNKCKEDDA